MASGMPLSWRKFKAISTLLFSSQKIKKVKRKTKRKKRKAVSQNVG